MNRVKIIVCLLLVFLTDLSIAQTTVKYETAYREFKEAVQLVNRNNYAAARIKFDNFLDQDPPSGLAAEARYYRAYCAMHLFHYDSEQLFENFVNNHPSHPKAIMAYFELGNFYYRNKKYEKSIESYEKVSVRNLSGSRTHELKFKLGYSYFARQKFEEALGKFQYAADHPGNFQGASAYYAAHILIELQDYTQALPYLEMAEKYPEYKQAIPVLKCKVLYGQGNYEELIAYSLPLVSSDRQLTEKNEIQLMLADAFFYQGDYRNAYKYYENTVSVARFSNKKDMLFRAGFTALQSGFFGEAVDFLKNAALSSEKTGQYASYYLGMAYIRLDNKNYAISAFEDASRKEFDEEIRHESFFYLGKLYFDTGKFKEALDALQHLTDTDYAEAHQPELNELISEAYLNTDDVSTAINYIESLPFKSERVKLIYQRVTFKKATELFNAGRYYDAVQMFNNSLRYSINDELVFQAYFWMGEAYSIGNRFEPAIDAYQNVLKNNPPRNSTTLLKTRYGLGYAFYNTRQYENAMVQFRGYVERVDPGSQQFFYDDAQLRLADCYYALRDYRRAISIYNRALDANTTEPDYCFYQLGLVHSILDNRQEAEKNFNMVISRFRNSVLLDDAKFQISQVPFEKGDYDLAIERYTRLINDHPQSPFVPHALIDRAISYSNLQQYQRSIDDYKKIIADYSQHPVANDALLGLQEALTAIDRSEEFSRYLTLYKQANPEDEDLARVEFESAKTLYYNQKYELAVEDFRQYTIDYPDSPFMDEVYYYLGESHYRAGNLRQAVDNFQEVIEMPNSRWYNRSVSRIAQIQTEQENHQAAINHFHRLLKIAGNRREEYDARAGLMENYYSLKKYDSTLYFSNLILEQGAFSVNARNRAQLLAGKAYLGKGETATAIDYFLETVNTAKDVHGAEAKYLIAEIYHEQDKFQQSNEMLFELNENFGIYELWVGRSFLLIAENFIAMDELFQARATLNSIIDNSPVEHIVEQAEERLAELEQLEQEKEAEKARQEEDTTGIN